MVDPEKWKGVTQEEVSKLNKAMKDKQFLGHMDEYQKEISDPAHRKEYLQYLDQLEAKGEMPDGQVLLRAEPGLCIKTYIQFKNGQTQKCFVNIVYSDRLADMFEDRDHKDGRNVQMPYSLGPPRPERDNKGEFCMTVDFAVGTFTYGQALQRPEVLKMLVDTATENLAKHHFKGHEEVKKDFKVMRRIQCRGPGHRPVPMSVKAEQLKDKGKCKKPVLSSVAHKNAVTPSELREMRKEAKAKQLKPKKTDDKDDEDENVPKKITEEDFVKADGGAPRIRVPKHKLIHSGVYDLTDFMETSARHSHLAHHIPKLLKLVVELPTVKKGSDISLDVTSSNICIEVPDKYYLDLPLSYEIEEDKGAAKFDKIAQSLTLELPVKPKLPDPNSIGNRIGFVTEDEGDTGDVDDDEEDDLGENCEEELPPLEEPDCAEPTSTEPSAEVLPTPVQPPRQMGPQPPTAIDEDLVLEEDMIPFIAAESFAGARQGYYFGMGDEGLGYYRDIRQKRPVREPNPASRKPTADIKLRPEAMEREEDIANETGAPLIEEIEDFEIEDIEEYTPAASSPKASAGNGKAHLPDTVQKYVDATTLLTSCIPASDIDHGGGVVEPAFDWRQTRQNFILRVSLAAGLEVAGLQLAFVGRRLTISFCTRLVGTTAWCQNRIRRTLFRAIDPRQWHADPPQRLAGDETSPMVIVLRKTEPGDKWVEAFDTSVPVDIRDPVIDAPDIGETAIVENTMQAQVGTGDTAAGMDIEMAVEDSAELDIAAPTVHGAPELESGKTSIPMPAKPWNNSSAANAAAQSATVMGQAVLLRTRLMYQLF